MTSNEIETLLLNELKDYGIIKWNTLKNGSINFKFNHSQLGTIRFSSEKDTSNLKYSYKITTSTPLDTVQYIIKATKSKANSIKDFDPTKYYIYVGYGKYQTVPTFEIYKYYISKNFPAYTKAMQEYLHGNTSPLKD